LDDLLLEFAAVGFVAAEGTDRALEGRGSVNQADVDFQVGAGFLNAALEQGAGVEFVSNLGRGFVAVAIGLGRGGSDHSQAIHVGQHGV